MYAAGVIICSLKIGLTIESLNSSHYFDL